MAIDDGKQGLQSLVASVNEDTRIKKMLSGIIKSIDTISNTVDKFAVDKGLTLKEIRDKSKKKGLELQGAISKIVNQNKEKLSGNNPDELANDVQKAEELDKEGKFKTSGTEPPDGFVDPNREKPKSESVAEAMADRMEGVFNKFLYGTEAVKDKVLSKEGGLKGTLTSALSGEGGDDKKGDKEPSWLQKMHAYASGRTDEVYTEKEEVQRRMKAKEKKAKGNWFTKALAGIFGLGGLGMMGLTKGFANVMWWTTKKMFGLMFKVARPVLKILTMSFKDSMFKIGRVIAGSVRWLAGPISSLGTFILEKGLRPLGTMMGGWFTRIVTAISTSKLGGKVGKLWKGAKNFIKSPLMRSIGSKLSYVGRAAKFIGQRALAFLGPVGWIVGAGFLIWEAYGLYKSFFGTSGKFPDNPAGQITRLRLLGYGLNEDNANYFKTILELEEIAGRFIEWDETKKEATIKTPDEQGYNDLYNKLNISSDEVSASNVKIAWYNKRFLKVYKEFLRAMWCIDNTIKPGQIDKLSPTQLGLLVADFNVPVDIYDFTDLPFDDQYSTTVTKRQFDDLKSLIIHKLKEDIKKGQKDEKNNKDRTREEAQKARDRDNKELEDKYNGDNIRLEKERRNKKGEGIDGEVTKGKFSRNTSRNGGGRREEGFDEKSIEQSSVFNNLGRTKDYGDTTIDMSKEVFTKGNTDRNPQGDELGPNPPVSIPGAFRQAAEVVGVPESLLWAFAKKESSLDVNAKHLGSAVGLFGITDQTKKEFKRLGYYKKYNIPENADLRNPLYSAILTGAYMKRNILAIHGHDKLGIPMSDAIYMAHFYGPTGVRHVLNALAKDPNTKMGQLESWTKKKEKNNPKMYNRNQTVASSVDTLLSGFREIRKKPAEAFEGFRKHKLKYKGLYGRDDIEVTNDLNSRVGFEQEGTRSFSEALLDTDSLNETVKKIGTSGAGVVAGNSEPEKGGFSPSANYLGSRSVVGMSTGSSDFSQPESYTSSGGMTKTRYQGYGSSSISSSEYTSKPTTSGNSQWNGKHGEGGGKDDRINPGDVFPVASGGVDDGPVQVHPIPPGVPYAYTSMYGPRSGGIHRGIDMTPRPNNRWGDPILCTADGVVWRSYFSPTYGNVVYINHPSGHQTRYAHMDKRVMLNEGASVSKGDLVGTIGNTGPATIKKIGGHMYPHLHFEVRKGHGQYGETIDPMKFKVIADAYKPNKETIVNKGGNDAESKELEESINASIEQSGVDVPQPDSRAVEEAERSEGISTDSLSSNMNSSGSQETSYKDDGSTSGSESSSQANVAPSYTSEGVRSDEVSPTMDESDKDSNPNVGVEDKLSENTELLRQIAKILTNIDGDLANKLSESIKDGVTNSNNNSINNTVNNNNTTNNNTVVSGMSKTPTNVSHKKPPDSAILLTRDN